MWSTRARASIPKRGATPSIASGALDTATNGDDPRPSNLGGSGLGLAIVHRLVTADGGRVELREADGGGVDAVVSYPARSS